MPLAGSAPMRRFTISRNGRVLVARFTNPPHHFLDSVACAELDALVAAAERDATIGAVVLTGDAPDRFITHFDAGELASAGRFPVPALPPRVGEALATAGLASTLTGVGRAVAKRFGPVGRALVTLQHLNRLVRRMHRSGTVWVAAINGTCLGGGLELALACDVRLAADDPCVTLGAPEVLAGIVPGAGGTQHLPRLLGTGKAVELLLTGEPVGAREAERIGLVTRVVPPAALLAEAVALAQRLATRSPAAVAAAKRAVYSGATLPFPAGLLIEAGGLIAAGTSVESRRLADAFEADLDRYGDSPFLLDPKPWVEGTHTGLVR